MDNILLVIGLIALGFVCGIGISIPIVHMRHFKKAPYAGDILLDWSIIDPSNISIQNPRNITKWENYKQLTFNVIVKYPNHAKKL